MEKRHGAHHQQELKLLSSSTENAAIGDVRKRGMLKLPTYPKEVLMSIGKT